MKNEIKCTNCKEGKHLQRRLDNYPEEWEFYKCDFCGSVWEREKIVSLKELLKPEDERTIKDIRLHQNEGARGSSIQVNYGDGWEKITIHIEND